MADPSPADHNRTMPRPVPLVPPGDRDRWTAPLPSPLTSFVGREREVAAVAALLRQDGVRLVTLTGPGGVGKTRLAQRVAEEVAADFAAGLAFVPLAAVRAPELVLPTVAQALGVREAGDRPLSERLAAFLGGKRRLLVLDNFEQVLDAAPLVTDLLRACPRLTALVTSRAVLRGSGEHAVRVPPLALPDPAATAEDLRRAEAVRLFAERARAADPDFALDDGTAEAVAAVCARLDGLPLAVELAAARVSVLSPRAMLARLETRLPLLTGGPRDAPARQRTMRDAIAWSHDLLAEEERRLFRRLAVFVGGFDLAAAAVVAAGAGDLEIDPFDGIVSLVDHSLLWRAADAGGEGVSSPRYVMLETVREYGLERLADSGEEDAVRGRHAAFFTGLAERGRSPVGMAGPRTRVAALEREDANLRAALGWAVAQGEAETGLRLATALFGYWHVRGRMREHRDWAARVLALGGDAAPALRALARGQLGFAALFLDDEDGAATAGARGLSEARAVGDATGAAIALNLLGCVAGDRGDHDRAGALLEEGLALSRRAGDPGLVAWLLLHAGNNATSRGDHDRAMARYEESLALRQEENNPYGACGVLSNLAILVRERGDAPRAARLDREALATAWDVRHEGTLSHELWTAAGEALAAGQAAPAARLLAAVDRLFERADTPLARSSRDDFERDLASARSGLGEPVFAAAWAAGQALPLAAAVAEADAVFAAAETAATSTDIPSAFGLSPREREVLRLVAAGRSNREIAAALFISLPTAKVHVRAVLTKLGLDSRTAAAAFAIHHGLA